MVDATSVCICNSLSFSLYIVETCFTIVGAGAAAAVPHSQWNENFNAETWKKHESRHMPINGFHKCTYRFQLRCKENYI